MNRYSIKRVASHWLVLAILLGLISLAAAPRNVSSAVSSTYGDGEATTLVINFMGNGAAQKACPSTTGLCDLKATASRTKGKVDLSWRYTGRSFRGFFLVERSTNRKTWSVVSTCKRSPTTTATSYACSDTGLRSGTTYYYRACASATGLQCGTTNLALVTPGVKAP
jgi:hypothetical protein